MSTNELLKSCRYFRGESSIPASLDDESVGFWLAEASAVDAVEEGKTDRLLSAYKSTGEPGKASNLPPILLAALFEYFCKGYDASPADCLEPFEKRYLPSYIASTSM